MKSKKLIFILFFLIFLSGTSLSSKEEFTFEVTEIEILNEGNLFKGLKRGDATSIDGNVTITADTFEYDRTKNMLVAKGNVVLKDKIKNYLIESNHITYYKNSEKIFSKGKTKAFFENKYEVFSSDVELDKITNIINTDKKTTIIDDNYTEYETDLFNYSIDNNLFKGKNIIISTNTNKEENLQETYIFKDGIFDLEKKDFLASETKIFVKKNIFDENDNDPRIFGKSSKKTGSITKINKAIFTSCKLNDTCPPWSIKATSITHDQNENNIIYDNPVLRVYDYPIFYFPKFSHPDPTVSRRSGFLQPRLNNSNVLGSSLNLPYFHILSENKDFTLNPTIFDSKIYMFQSEYRQKNDNSNLIVNMGFTKGYQAINESKNNIGNLFAKFTSKLNLENFIDSSLDLSIQKTTKDTFLKIFDTNLADMNKNIQPNDQNKLKSDINLRLEHENFNFNSGFEAYENLSGPNSDRYQYILPYYNFSSNIFQNSLLSLKLSSNGNNSLKETNKFKSIINNDLEISSIDFFSEKGFKSNLNLHFKNLNKVGKNSDNFKSSPQIELMNLVNLETSLPLLKYTDNFTNILTPKLSLRFNPGDMNDASNEDRTVNVNNIFEINRLGLSETLEGGKSLTLGLDYKKEALEDINKYFELKLAGIVRDVKQKNIPINSSLNQKTSNLFGSVTYGLSEVLNINYNFSVDNNFSTFEQNSIEMGLDFDKFDTNFRFTENNGKMGDTNVIENSTVINFNEENFLTFNTRRNRKINFTEYYDLVYEYKNDCLVAGIKYKKSYYQDRDVKPKEDLLFTITFFPLTQYEQKIDDNIYRN
jgi:LPS-assembly protein